MGSISSTGTFSSSTVNSNSLTNNLDADKVKKNIISTLVKRLFSLQDEISKSTIQLSNVVCYEAAIDKINVHLGEVFRKRAADEERLEKLQNSDMTCEQIVELAGVRKNIGMLTSEYERVQVLGQKKSSELKQLPTKSALEKKISKLREDLEKTGVFFNKKGVEISKLFDDKKIECCNRRLERFKEKAAKGFQYFKKRILHVKREIINIERSRLRSLLEIRSVYREEYHSQPEGADKCKIKAYWIMFGNFINNQRAHIDRLEAEGGVFTSD